MNGQWNTPSFYKFQGMTATKNRYSLNLFVQGGGKALDGWYIERWKKYVNGKTHYVKAAGGTICHMFFNPQMKCWVISDSLNGKEPPKARKSSLQSSGVGPWEIRVVKPLTSVLFKPALEQPERRGEEEEDPHPQDEAKGALNDYLEMENFFAGTLKWGESSHDSLLFSNNSQTASFLSLDPKAMKGRMHPQLKQFLIKNKISFDADLNGMSNRCRFALLGALTEVFSFFGFYFPFFSTFF